MTDPPYTGPGMEARRTSPSSIVEVPREVEVDEKARVYGSRWLSVSRRTAGASSSRTRGPVRSFRHPWTAGGRQSGGRKRRRPGITSSWPKLSASRATRADLRDWPTHPSHRRPASVRRSKREGEMALGKPRRAPPRRRLLALEASRRQATDKSDFRVGRASKQTSGPAFLAICRGEPARKSNLAAACRGRISCKSDPLGMCKLQIGALCHFGTGEKSQRPSR